MGPKQLRIDFFHLNILPQFIGRHRGSNHQIPTTYVEMALIFVRVTKPQKSDKISQTSVMSTPKNGIDTALTRPWMWISDFLVMPRLPSNQYLISMTWPK